MTNPSSTPPSPPPLSPAARAGVSTLSRELGDFLLEFSITLNKHAIYPGNHPLLDGAIDGIANRLGLLFTDERDSLSIGVARKQLIIEGVATDSHNPVLKELAERLHKHHVGAIKFVRGIDRDQLAQALAALAVDPARAGKPVGLDTDRFAERWEHLRVFPLTYDRLQLIEDDGSGEPAGPDQMAASRATQLWIGLARAALVSDTTARDAPKEEQDDNTALEPATVARAIDEHQREQAYDQVIVGYLLQIGEELKTAEGPEATGLQRRVSRLVGSLKQSTLERLLEMGGDKAQRRRFLLDASQGITVEAVIDLVKAASAAEGQSVSHSMLRMLSKLAHHPSAGTGPRQKTDPTVRDVMRRLVDDWSLDDPNPEGYRAALESMSSLKGAHSESPQNDALPTVCEPERLVQIAIEVGSIGPQVRAAMADIRKAGRTELLLDLIETAPNEAAGAPVWEFLVTECVFEELLEEERLDLEMITRFTRRLGMAAQSALLDLVTVLEDAKARAPLLDLIQSLGDEVAPAVATRLPSAPPPIQRELLALLGRLGALPAGFSARPYVRSAEPGVRREAVRLMLRDPSARATTIVTALSDADDRVVFVGLTAAQEKCPIAAFELIRRRVDRDDLDSQLRTMGIRVVAQQHTPDALAWLLTYVITEGRWLRRPRLRPSTPEMLAALSTIDASWCDDPEAAVAMKLAEESKDAEVSAKIVRGRAMTTKMVAFRNE